MKADNDPTSEGAGVAQAIGSTRSYDPEIAASYAKANYDRPYGPGPAQNPFGDFSGYTPGGNCANFVSQSILAGLVGETSAAAVFERRGDFAADKGLPLAWYYNSMDDRGPAFTGANELFEYASQNKAAYKGLHFTFITRDTPSHFMDYNAVKVGDVIFTDIDANGTADHSMLVTRTCGFLECHGYDKIHVTYQTNNVTDASLGAINEQYGKKALFSVFRPTDYNPSGL